MPRSQHTLHRFHLSLRGIYWCCYALILVIIIAIGMPKTTSKSYTTNELRTASSATDESFPIDIYRFSGNALFSREGISEMRKNVLSKYPFLAQESYTTTKSLFALANPQALWASSTNYYLYGTQKGIKEDVPLVGFDLTNPLLLIRPEFSFVQDSLWDSQKIENTSLQEKARLPLFPIPTSASLNINKKNLELNYDIATYLDEVNRWSVRKVTLADFAFFLIGDNAFDFGYRYIKVAGEYSKNSICPELSHKPLSNISLYAYTTKKCSSPEGCNMRISTLAKYTHNSLSQLPASLVIFLWKYDPSKTGAIEAPDFIISIFFT